MMRVCASLSLLALLSGAAFGQSDETAPKFEAADIHTSARAIGALPPIMRGPFYSSGRYEVRFATMVDLIKTAYGVEPERIYGGPNWLEMDRFDVIAIAPAGSTAESRRRMLQALLADRFKLTVHNDNKPMAANALTAGKHPQLKETEGSGDNGCNFNVQNAPQGGPQPGGGPIRLPTLVYTCHNMTMTAFADGMLSMAGASQYIGNKPVVDKTDLKGAWDFTFRYTPKVPATIQTTGESITFFEALDKQLGLKLEETNIPMPVVMVDSVNQKPTANPPEAAKAFPPQPTEFEVAEIKPSAPTGGRGGGNLRPEVKNGRIFLPGITLKNLIQIAWDVPADEMMANAPKWLDDDRYDIIAKAPAGVAMGDLNPTRSSIPVNIDAMKPMLQKLITDSFKMTTHKEERPVTTYVLSANKPKLKQADPASRTKWEEGAAPDAKGKNANASLGRLVTCHNVTMAQFAQLLPTIAPGYLRTEVVDTTGLEGGWDFTFSFSPIGALNGGGGGRGGDAGAGGAAPASPSDASDPSGALSLFDALNKQLGLKLESKKRPMPVLVIDHLERKPVDN
ncbi:MAG TPA: TIGR03435 family protein [Bryobacteraceae bacterium]|jgi:uncharacterized protein (TIGR03435 family)